MGKTVRIGVIGCGAIAELYHLPALKACARTADGIVLAEPNPARLKLLQTRFEVTQCVSDYQQLLGSVDGVIVATPPALHYTITKFFLENNIPVLCEKPLTESIEEARELVELAAQRGTRLAVNQTRRLFPTYQKIRELIAQGSLGQLESIVYHDGVVFSWPAASPHHFQPGAKGAWSDTGVHLLDSVCYWLDAQPELVQAQFDSSGGPEAMATVRLRHADCQIEIKVSRLGRLMNGFRIVGSTGTIEAEAEDWDEITLLRRDGTRQRFKCGSNRWQYVDFAQPLIENFAAVVAGEAEPLVSGASVLPTTQLLEEAYLQAEPYPMPWNERLPQLATPFTDAAVTAEPAASGRRVLVTGAAGFLGGRVVEAMLLSDFATPVAALREWSRAARVATRPVEVVICDIMDAAQVDRAVAGVDAIVHCAYGDDRDSIVEGTRHLLDAAVRHGVDRFVYLSSAEAYGPDLAGVVTEEAEVRPSGADYGDAKLEAEQLCRLYHAQGLQPTILRPSLIYGPFGLSWSVDIATRLLSGKWGLFEGFGDGIANLVYVDDLVQAIFLAIAVPEARGETFNVNGPERVSWNDYFATYNAALGRPALQPISPTSSRVRTWFMDNLRSCTSFAKSRWEDKLMEIYLRGGLASRGMKRLKAMLKSTPSSGELTNLFCRQANYDDTKIRQLLGYQPQYDLQTGLAGTVEWLALHEIIPSRETAGKGDATAANDTFADQEVPALT